MSTVLHDIASAATVQALASGTVTAAGGGAGVDLGQGDGPCTLIHHVVAVSGTNPNLIGSLYESNSSTTGWTLMPVEIGEVSTANDLQVVQFYPTKRYVSYGRSVTGTTPSFTLSVLVIRQRKTID